jgi:hypothetical protein
MRTLPRIAALGLLLIAAKARAEEHAPTISWHADYRAGYKAAAADNRLLLLWFFDPQAAVENERFETQVLRSAPIAAAIERRYVAAKLPLDAKAEWDEKPAPLLTHPSLAEMRKLPGLAIIDLSEPEGAHFRQVVSVYPFSRGPIAAEKLAVLLDLPCGTLTQRTLIYAVRTHPDHPSSTESHLSTLLLQQTQSHATHQASIALQGHHNWEQRFHAINAQLAGGLVAQEVCAESWPGQDLVEAAEECVDSWRQSPGHWDAVSKRHVLFGYDMQRGANGVWYAAGIFAQHH